MVETVNNQPFVNDPPRPVASLLEIKNFEANAIDAAVGRFAKGRLFARAGKLNVSLPCMAAFRFVLLLTAMVTCMGCGTTTQKLATEQLLISDAVDSAIARIEFDHLSGQKVYLDTTYLRSVRGLGFVNSDYIISSLRQQLMASRCLLQEKKEDASVIVEPRVGALGTDGHEVTYGLPQGSAISTAAAAISSAPVAPAIPEISVGRNDAQTGIAKILVFAYDRETKQPVWQSGVAKAESTSSNTWLLGAGPFQKGSIYDGFRFAGKKIEPAERPRFGPLANRKTKGPEDVDLVELHKFESPNYGAPHVFDAVTEPPPTVADEKSAESDSSIKQVSHEEPDGAEANDAKGE